MRLLKRNAREYGLGKRGGGIEFAMRTSHAKSHEMRHSGAGNEG